MKKIIILDDHCQKKYFYLLEDYLVAIDEYFKAKHSETVEFIKCADIKEFASVVLSENGNEYNGWIVDMMVPTNGLKNYALLGRPDIIFNTARSGILTLKAIMEYDKPINILSDIKKSALATLASCPVLALSILRESNLASEINNLGIVDVIGAHIFYSSKSEIDVIDLKLPKDIWSWCDQVMAVAHGQVN